MNVKYFGVDKSPYAKDFYFITINEEVHKLVKQKFDPFVPFSYHMVIIGLFGLMPHDYFNYVANHFHATVKGSKGSVWKVVYFSNLKDAHEFATECNKRFSYCVEQGYFNG